MVKVLQFNGSMPEAVCSFFKQLADPGWRLVKRRAHRILLLAVLESFSELPTLLPSPEGFRD